MKKKPVWKEVFWLEEKIRDICKDVTKVVYVFDDLPGDDPYVVSLPYFRILFFSFLRNRY